MFRILEEVAPPKMTPGMVLLQAKFGYEAMPFLIEEVRENPGQSYCWSNLSLAYRQIGDLHASMACIERAFEVGPKTWELYYNRGKLREWNGQFSESLEDFQLAFNMSPSEQTSAALCFALFRMERYKDGVGFWQDCHPTAWMQGVQPWNREDLRGKRIMVLRHGGYGDIIWQWRYMGLLNEMGAETCFYGPRCLRGLLEGHPWLDQWFDSDTAVDEKEFDFQIPLMMIMAVTGIMPYPMRAPYLNRWAALGYDAGKIGVCWSAGELGQVRSSRCLSKQEVELLFPTGHRFISLQPGECPDWMEPIEGIEEGFHRTAQKMMGLDLVITVDTAVAHLAGAMGVPTFLILPKGSDWKWYLDRSDSPWYLPSFRIFRSSDPLSMVPALSEAIEALQGEPARV